MPSERETGGARSAATPEALRAPHARAAWLAAGALAAFALRDLLRIDRRVLDADGLLEWFTFPTGIGFPLVLAGAAWLAWRRRGRWLARTPVRPPWLAGLLAVASVLAALWSAATGVADLQVFAAAFAGAAFAARRGAAGLRVHAVPLLFLGFALAPPPRLVNEAFWWIQTRSADAATAVLRASGAQIVGEGIALTTPTEVFGIVESCTALGILVVLGAGAVLLRERIADAGARSWLLVALAPPVALALNLARITAIIVHPPLNRIHHLGQWAVLLCLGAAVLALVAWLLRRRDPTPAAAARARPIPPGPRAAAFACALAAVLAGISLLPAPGPREERPTPPPREIPMQHGAWAARDVTLDPTFLGFVMFRDAVARRYEKDGRVVDLLVGEASPRSDVSSPFSPKTLLPGMGWVPVAAPAPAVRDALPRPPSQTAWVGRNGARWWVVQWRFGDPGPWRESLRQLFALDASPFSAGRPRRVIRLATPVDAESDAGVAEARRTLAEFVDEFDGFLFPAPFPPGATPTS